MHTQLQQSMAKAANNNNRKWKNGLQKAFVISVDTGDWEVWCRFGGTWQELAAVTYFLCHLLFGDWQTWATPAGGENRHPV